LLLFFYKKTKIFKYTGFIFPASGIFSFALENQVWLIVLGSVTVLISLFIGIRELKVYDKDLERGVKVQITTIVFMLLMLARFVFMFGL
jgi:amino acid transporter